MNYLNQLNNRRNTNAVPSLFEGLDEQLAALFSGNTSKNSNGSHAANAVLPNYRWYDKEAAYQLQIDLPGLKTKDIELEWRDGFLSVSATRHFDEVEDKSSKRAKQELKRTFEVPDDVNQETVTARYVDGVLNLTLPKQEEKKPRKIAIN